MSTPLFSSFVNIFSIILNSFWSLLGLIIALLHYPISIGSNKEPLSLIIHVQYAWILDNIPGYKNWRGITLGNIVVLNSREEDGDKAHELIHVEQFMRYPGIFPLMYQIETYKNGYRQNKFEVEAYDRASNVFYQK